MKQELRIAEVLCDLRMVIPRRQQSYKVSMGKVQW